MRCPFALLALLSLIVSAPVLAQTDPCSCNVALLDGVYASRIVKNDLNAKLDVVSRLQLMTYEEFRDAVSGGGGASFLGFGFNANMTKEQFQRRQSELRTEYTLSSSTTSNQELLERYGDANVLGAWSQCKSTCNRTGLLSWIEVRDPLNMVLQLKWTPTPGEARPLKVRRSSVDGATVVGGSNPNRPFNRNAEIPVGLTPVPLKRAEKDDAVWVHVEIPGYTVAEFVPAYVEPLPDPPPAQPPALLCHSTPTDAANSVSINVAASCLGCPAKSDRKQSWEGGATSVSTDWQTNKQGWLSAHADASVTLSCDLTPNGYRVAVEASHTSKAGWGGTPGDYRASSASVNGVAQTGFRVDTAGKFCLLAANIDQRGTRKKGYPTSSWFPEGTVPAPVIRLKDPAGADVGLSQGASVPLDRTGLGRMEIPISSSHASNMAENSGSFALRTSLVFRFVPKTNGRCP
jgi:hypothetical protein